MYLQMHVLWRHVLINNTHYINNDENEKNGPEFRILRVGRIGGSGIQCCPTLIMKQQLK